MTATESRELKKGSRVCWGGNVADSGKITETNGVPSQSLGIITTSPSCITVTCAKSSKRGEQRRFSMKPDPNNYIDAPSCRQCSRTTELLYVLPKFDRRPSFHIFLCNKCGSMEWIGQLDL
jgi:hypothetical protein